MWIVLGVLLTALPGALAYDYNVGGLVAAAAAGVLLLLPIIALLVVIARWREWYMKRQLRKGKVRVPRRYWSTFKMKNKRHTTVVTRHTLLSPANGVVSSPTVVSTPRSDRKSEVIRMYNIPSATGDRHVLMDAAPPVGTVPVPQTGGYQTGGYQTGSYQTGSFVVNKIEEDKIQSIDFGAEDEPVIEADVVTDDRPQEGVSSLQYTVTKTVLETKPEPYYVQQEKETIPVHYTVTQSGSQSRTEPYYVRQDQEESSQLRYTVSQSQTTKTEPYYIRPEVEENPDEHTTIIRLGGTQQPEPEEATHFRSSQGKREVYHVKAQVLNKTTGGEGREMYISPSIPSSNVGTNDENVIVMRATSARGESGTLY